MSGAIPLRLRTAPRTLLLLTFGIFFRIVSLMVMVLHFAVRGNGAIVVVGGGLDDVAMTTIVSTFDICRCRRRRYGFVASRSISVRFERTRTPVTVIRDVNVRIPQCIRRSIPRGILRFCVILRGMFLRFGLSNVG